MRVVLDTDLLVAGLRSPDGASRELLRAALAGRVSPLVSTPLLLEYETVLTRPGRLAETGLTVLEVIAFIDALLGRARPVTFDIRWRPTDADADDEHVLETAINGQAEAIVTFNLRHLAGPAARFGIHATRPGSFLRELKP